MILSPKRILLSFQHRRSILRDYWSIFQTSEKRVIYAITISMLIVSILDLIGILLFGMLGLVLLAGENQIEPNSQVGTVLRVLHIYQESFNHKVFVIALVAAFFFVLKTVLTLLLTKQMYSSLAKISASITHRMNIGLFENDLNYISKLTVNERIFSNVHAVDSFVLGFTASSISLAIDIFLLFIFSSSLMLFNVPVTIGTLVYFIIIGVILDRFIGGKTKKLGSLRTSSGLYVIQEIQNLILLYRLFFTSGLKGSQLNRIKKTRDTQARVFAEIAFIPNISKYILEVSLVLGTFLLVSFEFYFEDTKRAVATIAIFLTAGARIAPTTLRIQQNISVVRTNLHASNLLIEIYKELQTRKVLHIESTAIKNPNSYVIMLKEVYFRYETDSEYLLKEVNFEVAEGKTVYLVGKSGSGKSTIADLITGVTRPSSGLVTIGGVASTQVPITNPGIVGYVPQNTVLIPGTIRDNLSLNANQCIYTDAEMWESLRHAQLEKIVLSWPEGLNTDVGEFGSKISGGQRQRIGIARALIRKPKILILDEASNALDAETENSLIESISQLPGNLTKILISHSEEFMRVADIVLSVDDGSVNTLKE